MNAYSVPITRGQVDQLQKYIFASVYLEHCFRWSLCFFSFNSFQKHSRWDDTGLSVQNIKTSLRPSIAQVIGGRST